MHQANYVQALPLFQRALAIYEKSLGPDHPKTAIALNNLAGLYQQQGNFAKALSLYEAHFENRRKSSRTRPPRYCLHYQQFGRTVHATGEVCRGFAAVSALRCKICEAALGPEHPTTATCMEHIGYVYKMQGNYAEALPLYQAARRFAKPLWDRSTPTRPSFLPA